MKPAFPIASLLFASAAIASPAQFQLDPQHTGRTDVRGPHTSPHITWRVRTRERVFASPLVGPAETVVFAGIDGHVHVLGRDGVEHAAFDAPGAMLSTPAIGDGADTYVAFDGGGVAALDARGFPRWVVRATFGIEAPLALADDGTVYAAGRELLAIDRGGAVRWRALVDPHVFGAPAVSRDGTVVYVADLAGRLSLVRTSDGRVVRRVSLGSPAFGGVTVLPDDSVVVGLRDGHVRSFASDGTARWSFSTGDEVHATAALARDGTVVIGSDDGVLYDLDPVDGHEHWRVATDGRVRASARVDADGWIFVGSEDDVLRAIRPDGTLAWSFPLGSDIDDAVALAPWGTLYVGADDAGLYALDAP